MFVALDSAATWAESPTTPLGSGTAPVILAPPSGAVTDLSALTVVGRLPAGASEVSVNGVAAIVRGLDFEARAVPVAVGANTLRAVAAYVDGRSGEASVSIVRAAEPELALRIFSPPSQAVVAGGGLVVRGFVSARDARVLVGAGGFAPVQNGIFTVTDVFPPVGSSQVEAAAQRAAGGAVATHAVPISVQSAQPALALRADPTVGEPALTSTLELSYHAAVFPIARIDFDLDGDGQLDRVAAPSPTIATVLPSARAYQPRAWVATPSGVELSASTRVRVELPFEIGETFAAGNPVDLAPAGAGDVFVLDRAAGTVSRYDQERQLVSRFGSPGVGADQLLNPEGIAIGPGPRIYVADTGNDRIQVFRTDDTLERTIGSSGAAPGQLSEPRGIAVSGDELVVADAGNGRVQALALDGTPRRSAPVGDPRGVGEVLGAGVLVAVPGSGLLAFGERTLQGATGFAALPPEAALDSVVDVSAGEELVVVADAGAERVVVLDDDLRLRRVLLSSGAAPVAVLPSARREVESVYVADGAAVREVRLPVPSPVPVVQALRTRLLASDIPGALALIHPLQRTLFDEIYHDIEPDLPVDAAAMGAMRVDLVRGNRAVVRMETVIVVNGQPQATRVPVHLVRAEDGTWQVLDY